ncbi:MAG: insulinase family protein [Cyclobacteriaceae bacterium]|nr:insulinase family protein [Cyclobacteriaceae bacterium]
MRDHYLHELPNGIRLVYKQVPTTKIVHCGFVLDIGSRDEGEDQQGMAHFWEHMAFKGTKKRKAYHILNGLEGVGGELNAYTTKEKICFYASVLDHYFEKAVELLTDITFNSTFPQKQIEKERTVILEEMAMYYDAPDEALQDDFDDLIFRGHQLGRNILGDQASVARYTQEDFEQFISQNLRTDRLVFSCVGNLPFEKVTKVFEKHLGAVTAHTSSKIRQQFQGYQPRQLTKSRTVTQAHYAMGRTAYSIVDPRRLPFFTLVNLLGGPGMNSRLNLALRERHGYVYAIDAQYTPYMDTGMFAVYFGTDPKNARKSVALVKKELRSLREKPLGTMQLHRAKEQLIGQLAMAEENNMNLMLMMGKSMLDLGQIRSLEQIFKEVRSISARQLQELANEMFHFDDFSTLIFLPK